MKEAKTKLYLIVIGNDQYETETILCKDGRDQERQLNEQLLKGREVLVVNAAAELLDVDGPYGPVKIDPTLAQSRKMAEDLDACPTKWHDVKNLLDQADTILKNGDQCVSVEGKVGALRHAMQLMTEAIWIVASPARG